MKHSFNFFLNVGCAGIAGLLLSSCATPGSGFSAADSNNDGQLSVAELKSALVEAIFGSSDLDQDGKISPAEWKTAHPEASPGMFQRADSNADGLVDIAEAHEAARTSDNWNKLMRSIDTNNNQVIEPEEYVAFETRMAEAGGPTLLANIYRIAAEE